MERKEILEKMTNPEDRVFTARVLDKIEAVGKIHSIEVTDFCDPYQQQFISPVLLKIPGISFLWDGGYKSAERRKLVLFPDYMDENIIDTRLELLAVDGNLKFQSLLHRDFLGTILGLGIKREKVGDIIVVDTGCQVIVDPDIADYIIGNLVRVHRVSVKAEKVPMNTLKLPEEKLKEVFATVPSLRLDAVASSGFSVSRSKMAEDIKTGKVRVNWSMVCDCSYIVREGDKISIRGSGRIEIAEVRGQTKKGRMSLILKRYQ